MIKYICDRCKRNIPSKSLCIQHTLQSVAPAEDIQVDFCSDCYDLYIREQVDSKIAIDMKFLKEMEKV